MMRFAVARATILALAFAATTAAADTLDDFNRAVESAAVHRRATLGYLRAGNRELAARELAHMRETWGVVVSRFGRDRPEVFRDGELYTTTLVDVSMRLVTASIMLDSGRPDGVRESLSAIRGELAKLRQSGGVLVLSDCLHDATAALDALEGVGARAPDLSHAEERRNFMATLSAYGATIERCAGMADDPVRRSPAFSRPVEGIRAGLARARKSIAGQDENSLREILAELRKFDNQLADRFG